MRPMGGEGSPIHGLNTWASACRGELYVLSGYALAFPHPNGHSYTGEPKPTASSGVQQRSTACLGCLYVGISLKKWPSLDYIDHRNHSAILLQGLGYLVHITPFSHPFHGALFFDAKGIGQKAQTLEVGLRA